MDERSDDVRVEGEPRASVKGNGSGGSGAVNRRDLLRLTLAGTAGLALDGLIDVPAMRAATQNLKLSSINEFTTS